jgi:hypothetical protein
MYVMEIISLLSLFTHLSSIPCPKISSFAKRTFVLNHFLRQAGLPDGIFSNQNPNLGKFWRDFQLKVLVYFWPLGLIHSHLVYIICGHLEYFTVVWYIFPPFWYVVPRKIWQPWRQGVGPMLTFFIQVEWSGRVERWAETVFCFS